jgi:predicted dithiol-disulfide oxidoreductase (DUF899 family)
MNTDSTASCCSAQHDTGQDAGHQPAAGPDHRAAAFPDNAYPPVADRRDFEDQLAELRVREKAHTRAGDAIAAARRRMPMVEVPADTVLIGANGEVSLLDAFEGRTRLITYYMMWYPGNPAAQQCEGCTWNNTQMGELSYLHARDITYAVFCQGPYPESARYREFMGWSMPWYSALDSLDTLLEGRTQGMMHLVCYLRRGDRVFETYWTTQRGVEVVDINFHLMDLTTWGRQEPWEDSPEGWPQFDDDSLARTGGRPTAQWSRIAAGRNDDLAAS